MSQILKSRDRWKRTDGALSGMYVARFNHAALYREHFPRSDSSFCFYQTCTGDSSVSLPAESLRVYPPSACQSPPLYLFTSIPTFPGNGRVVQQSSLHVTGRGGGRVGVGVGRCRGCVPLNTVQRFSMSLIKTSYYQSDAEAFISKRMQTFRAHVCVVVVYLES